jgi:tetratricopeptide (TPR) repeat protein
LSDKACSDYLTLNCHNHTRRAKIYNTVPTQSPLGTPTGDSSSPLSIYYYYKTNRNWGIPIETYRTSLLSIDTPQRNDRVTRNYEILYIRGIEITDGIDREQTANELRSAIDYFDRALKIAPDYTPAYTARADIYLKLILQNQNNNSANTGNYATLAIEDYTKAIQRDPRDAYLYLNRGIARFNEVTNSSDYRSQTNSSIGKERLREAIADLDLAISILPDYALAHSFKGMILFALHNSALQRVFAVANTNLLPMSAAETAGLNTALVSLDRAIQLDPNQGIMHLMRSYVRLARQEYREAARDMERSAEVDLNGTYSNDSITSMLVLIWILADEDLEAIRATDRLSAGNYRFFNNYYSGAYLSGIPMKAFMRINGSERIIIGRIDSERDPAKKIYLRGILNYLKNDFAAANLDFNRTIEMSPNYAEAYIARNLQDFIIGDRRILPDLEKAAILFQQRGNRVRYDLTMQAIARIRDR